ncbi:cupin [Croceivirga radicis]|uniref:Cupin n=1 Tax=Croceivirga radicis TaxID=1929488 RepID=A0A1V6LN60_9FLAO|nr:cupin domain-containing protein [Croceivirga radicis]OQD41578.1 cupin [Croceivirga radicis]
MNLKDITAKEILPGLHGKLIHGDALSWAFWEVEAGAIVPEHHHIHEQIMHVVTGQFEFSLNGESKTYVAGDVVVIPSNVPHGGKAITPCKLMDVFTPVREDYK